MLYNILHTDIHIRYSTFTSKERLYTSILNLSVYSKALLINHFYVIYSHVNQSIVKKSLNLKTPKKLFNNPIIAIFYNT